MHDLLDRALVNDLQRFATECADLFNRAAVAAYDLREACRFYTEGANGSDQSDALKVQSEPGSEQSDREGGLRVHEGDAPVQSPDQPQPDRGRPEAKSKAWDVKFDHILTRRHRGCGYPPSKADALRILESLGKVVPLRDYYAAMNELIKKEDMIGITQTGMRYLAYLNGYKRRDVYTSDGHSRAAFVAPKE